MSRAAWLDWVRGVAVILMIQTHVSGAWVRPAAKVGAGWSYFNLTGGAPAPLFTFLAGVSLALLLRRAERAGASEGQALWQALRRAGWLLGVALAVRAWFFVSSGAKNVAGIWRVDVLNCMALSLAVSAVLGYRHARGRFNLLPLVAGFAVSAASPLVAAAWPEAWKQTLPFTVLYGERPASLFPFFPWAGFTLVGFSAGTLWTSTREPVLLRRIMGGSAVAGLALVAIGLALWRQPWSPYPSVEPWRTGPPFFLVRVGLLLALCALAWALHARAAAARASPAWSPVRQLGATSLLVYWVHLELAYGRVTRPLHGRLGLAGAVVGTIVLTLGMLALSVAKTRLSQRLRRHRGPTAATTG